MDLALLFNMNGNPFLTDIAIDGLDLKVDQDLATAIEMSIFTNKRASKDDLLPYPDVDLQGWWGDTYSQIPGDLIGSKVWTLVREVESTQTALIAKNYVVEALNWLITDNIASSIIVNTEFVRAGILGISVEVFKPNGNQVFRYSYVWGQI